MTKIKSALADFTPDPRLVDERGPTQERANKIRPSPINLMLTAKPQPMITSAEALAAEKFYKHYVFGGLEANVPSMDMAREVFGGDGFNLMPVTESQAFHRARFRKIKELIENRSGQYDHKLGPLNFWAAEMIILHEKPLTEVGGVLGHKNRTRAAQVAKDLLLSALRVMCKEWGIS